MTFTKIHRFCIFAVLCLFTATFIPATTAFGASGTIDVVPDENIDGSVQLTPGYISGTVDIGGQSISRIDLAAQSQDYSAKVYPTSEGPYTMTVNVPKGGSLSYDVSGMVWMNNWNTRLYFKDRSATVSEGQTSKVDFIVNAGYIDGQIVSDGCSVASGEVWAILDNGTAYSRAYVRFGPEAGFRLPIQPNAGIRVYGQVQFANGATYSLSTKYIDIAPGEDTPVSWDFDCGSGALGAIQHNVNYHMEMDYHYSYLYNQGAWSPYRTARHTGAYLFDDIAPGNWRLYTYSYWNNGHNLISKYMTGIDVPAGETVYVNIDEVPGFLQGKVTLTGTQTIEDTRYAYIYGYGKNAAYPSFQTTSRALIGSADGAFNLALPHGEWDAYLSTYYFYNPDPAEGYLQSHLYMYDYSLKDSSLFIEAGQTISDHALAYETGSATIKYTRSDGGAFSSPHIYAKSYQYKENGALNAYVYSYSYGETDSDKVTFVGFPGSYEVDAWAYVDGSLTMFGKATIEIIPGVDKVVDLGGPALTVQTPLPGITVDEKSAIVTGTATDDMGIDRITINGEAASIQSTQNPDDPNEVTFSLGIELTEGKNPIETIAYDLSGNASSDKRSVIYEIPIPTMVSVLVDIKPGSCKNPVNIGSKGVLPVVVLGSEEFDTANIAPETIRLAGISPVRWSLEDAATPLSPAQAVGDDSECRSDTPDGYTDLTLKFKTVELVEALGQIEDGQVLTLQLTGAMVDETEISGEDGITILSKGKKKK